MNSILHPNHYKWPERQHDQYWQSFYKMARHRRPLLLLSAHFENKKGTEEIPYF
jgi:hypothetical protein